MAQQGGYYQQQQPWGYQQQQPGGYQQQQPGGYQQQHPGGYQQQHPGGYQQQPSGGYQQQPPGGYQQQQAGGYGQVHQQQPVATQQHHKGNNKGRHGKDNSTANCRAITGIVFGACAVCSGAALCGIPAIVLGSLVVSDCYKGNKRLACGSLALGLVGFLLMITFWVLIGLWTAGWWSYGLEMTSETRPWSNFGSREISRENEKVHDSNSGSWSGWRGFKSENSWNSWKRSRDEESQSVLRVASDSAIKTASKLENQFASETGDRVASESANKSASESMNKSASESANKTASESMNKSASTLRTASQSANKMKTLKTEKANVSSPFNSTKRFEMTKAKHFQFLKWN